jgi:hypothetical protein
MLALFPMCAGLSPARSTTGPPPHPRPSAGDGPALPQNGVLRVGQLWAVPVFHASSIGQVGVQLCPGSLATSTPQFFGVASPPALLSRLRSWPGTRPGHALLTDPCPPGLSRHLSYGTSTTGSLTLRLLTSLAGPATSGSSITSRRCQGCSHPSRRPPGQAALSFDQAAATAQRSRHCTSTRQRAASRRITTSR